MSFREDSDDGRGDLRKPFLHTGSWYRMGSRQSSMMGSSQTIRDGSISVLACVLIVALGPIQFGFTVLPLDFHLKAQFLLYHGLSSVVCVVSSFTFVFLCLFLFGFVVLGFLIFFGCRPKRGIFTYRPL